MKYYGMDGAYEQVDDVFYEELKMLAARRRSCEIIFRSENGARTAIRSRIAEIVVREGKGWLRTESGLSISLDRVERVNGKASLRLA